MSLGDVDLNRRPAAVFIRNSTSFFIDQRQSYEDRKCLGHKDYIYFVNDMTEGHFINPSEFFTQSPKTSPIGPF